MKVAIIVFSPAGNTLKVAKMLEKSLEKKQNNIQIINITRNKELFRDGTFRQFLSNNVKAHDILCLGAPVYAHHLQYNMQNLIKSLPKPGNGWGELAIPFVTYGGVNSGIALQEAAKLLKKTGRIPIAGLKIESEHCMTRLKQINTKVNEGMPGDEINHLTDEVARKIKFISKNTEYKDISKMLCYQNLMTRIKAKILFRERIWQKFLYPKLTINYDICTSCNKCSRVCPVQRIEMTNDGPVILEKSPNCIHCGSCISNCPSGAISFNADMEKWGHLLKKAIEGNSIISSNEEPKSAFYI